MCNIVFPLVSGEMYICNCNNVAYSDFIHDILSRKIILVQGYFGSKINFIAYHVQGETLRKLNTVQYHFKNGHLIAYYATPE